MLRLLRQRHSGEVLDTILQPVERSIGWFPQSDRVIEILVPSHELTAAYRLRHQSDQRSGSIMASQASLGQMLASMLLDSLHGFQAGPVGGDHER